MEKSTEGQSGQRDSGVRQGRQERRQYWGGHIQQWRGSGLTQKEYCRREGISLERFGAWKRRMEREEHSGALVAVPPRIVSAALSADSSLRLVVEERYRVEIPDAFSSDTLEKVLRVLNRL